APDMVVISMSEDDMDAINLAERIIAYRPKCFVVLVADRLDMDVMQSAMKIGAHNVTTLSETPGGFAEYIKGVYNSESLRIRSLSEKQDIAWSSKVITLFSPKAGLGKTTIAVNLASALAEKGKKVAIIDLNLQFGDVPLFMDLDPKDTIAELIQDTYNPNIDTIRSYMMIHSSGIHVLCAPKSPEYAEVITVERVQGLISTIRSYYDFVIIDTVSAFNDITMTAIESSNTVLFITGLDVSILKNSRISMNLLDSLQQKDKLWVVVNRAMEMTSISLADVEKVLQMPIRAKLPSDYMVSVNALNKGVPFVTDAPANKLSVAVQEIAASLLSGEDVRVDTGKSGKKKEKKSLFGKNNKKG
ncbi:MAG: AAA family ATPase, partial [Eubacteriaceae bacterium]|nr:AAA family ATPase [Eubacteriaceae bacterium]